MTEIPRSAGPRALSCLLAGTVLLMSCGALSCLAVQFVPHSSLPRGLVVEMCAGGLILVRDIGPMKLEGLWWAPPGERRAAGVHVPGTICGRVPWVPLFSQAGVVEFHPFWISP